MEDAMKEISRMAKKTVKVLLSGLTISNILEAGSVANSTVLVYYTTLKKTPRSKVNGTMAKELGGSKAKNFYPHPRLLANREFDFLHFVFCTLSL